MSNRQKGNRIIVWLGLATFAWTVLSIWQGLDFTDMGFWLTGFQQFYSHPETMGSLAVCWLSFFIGHWLGAAFGSGVLAYKLGYVAVITASAMIAYRLLSSQFGRSRMLAALVLLTAGFMRVYGTNWVSYNDLTALFYLAGAAILFFGLVGDRSYLVVLAGVVLGANSFVRLPNLLGVSLVAAIWLHAWGRRWTFRAVLVGSACFLGGFLLGVALVWGLIVIHGHKAVYYQSILMIFDLARGVGTHHSSSGLLKRLIDDHIRAFAEALFIVVAGGWIANWAGKQKPILASVFILTGALLLFYVISIRSYWPWCVAGICYVVLGAIIFLNIKKDSPSALLAFIAGMVLFLVPLGSDQGIVNSIFGMWIALPITLIWLWRRPGCSFPRCIKEIGDGFEPDGKFTIVGRGFRIFAMTILLALILQSLASAWQNTFRDSKNRFTMRYSIARPLLLGTFTTAERAKAVTELLEAMSHFTKPGDEVLAYNGIPSVYFLTETHPWFGISWPDIEGAEKIANLIREKEQTGTKVPCIVRATGSTYTDSWPIVIRPLDTSMHRDETRRVFAEFEQRHGYVVAWSNGFFEILTPAK